jgi:hypothetical protein
MRKKIAAYTITAMLMGFAIMMLPLALETGPPTYQPKIPGEYNMAPSSINGARDETRSLYGLTSQPANILPFSIILLIGLIAGLSAYTFFKKQTIQR